MIPALLGHLWAGEAKFGYLLGCLTLEGSYAYFSCQTLKPVLLGKNLSSA